MSDSKRIFVGVKASKYLQTLAISFARQNIALPVRWTSAENLHFTLVSPWEENESGIEIAAEKLSKLERGNRPAVVELDRICYGPDRRTPRLIQAVGRANTEMLNLWRIVNEVLGKKYDRPFRPHLTLARFRPEEFGRFTEKELDKKISWVETIEKVALFSSTLMPEGAKYEIIKNFAI